MKYVTTRLVCVSAMLLAFGVTGQAQEVPTAAVSTDPRVGLKPGLTNAGEVAKGVEKIASVPKPEGFFDPKAPAGEPTSPERNANEPDTPPAGANPPAAGEKPPAAGEKPPAAGEKPPAAGEKPQAEGGAQPPRPARSGLNFANSDMAFSQNHMFMGNFNGFNTYDIDSARRPRLIASVVCPGGQGDVSVHGNLLFMSVEQTRGRLDCGTAGVEDPVSAERFRGVRIFDITDVRKPRQIAAVQTCRGSHTHTLVVDPDDKENLYIYGSGTSSVRSGEELAGCSKLDPKEDPNTSLFSIDVIQVPLASPEKARIVNRPRIFADLETGAIAGLWAGGDHGPGTQRTSTTNQCHDITVFPEVGLAAGACSGNGILLDISDPVNPKRLDAASDKSFAYWHSATFNNDGTKVIFTDEWGGGTRPRCRATDSPTWGANAVFDIVDGKKLEFGAYYKLPAPQTEQENCVAHNGSIIPVPGRDIMVQAWYQGGLSIFDFTDSANPVEIGYFDRGPLSPTQLITGGYWSTYWYNGQIYGAEIARGLDVFRLVPTEHLTQNEIDAATQVLDTEVNTQMQEQITWPATSEVARAYLDQLARTSGIQPARAEAVKAALARADSRAENAAAQLETLATQVASDAAAASGRDAERLKALAETLKGRADKLR